MYWFARLVREIEERLVILFRQSKVRLPSKAHFCPMRIRL